MSSAAPLSLTTGSPFAAHWRWLILLSVIYLAVFVHFYPPTFGIEDEAGYINQAFIWQHGSITAEGAGYAQLADFEPRRGHQVSFRNPGRALTLLPFLAAFGIRSIFVSSAIIHLLTVWAGALLLARMGKSPLWAVLLLFHPTMALYSRTVMSDELSGLLLLLAVVGVTSKKMRGLLAGLALSAAVVSRYHSALVVPFFIVALFFDKGWRDAFICLVTTGCCAVAIVAYNYWAFGNLSGGYTNKVQFGPEYLGFNLKYYLPALLLLWPLQLFAPFVDRSSLRWYVRACCLPVFVLLAFYFFHETGESALQTLVLGQRLLLTILPIWIVSYAYSVDTWLRPIVKKYLPPVVQTAAVASFCAALAFGTVFLFRAHQAHLAKLQNAIVEIEQNVPAGSVVVANKNLVKFLGTPASGIKSYEWLVYQFLDRPLDHSARLAAEREAWYLVILPRRPGEELPETLQQYISKYHMVPVPTKTPGLIFYEAPASRTPTAAETPPGGQAKDP